MEWIQHATGALPDGYRDIGSKYLIKDNSITSAHFLFQAFISRGRGLHEGALRGIECDNPHGTFPLIRTYVELVGTLLYCVKNATYIDVLMQTGPHKDRGKKSFEAMLDAIKIEAPGMKAIYKNLSEYSHFRELAIYNVQTPNSDATENFTWTDKPHWRAESDFKIACAQLAELQEALLLVLDEFGEKYLVNFSEDRIIGKFH
jgi:hypothetical protein